MQWEKEIVYGKLKSVEKRKLGVEMALDVFSKMTDDKRLSNDNVHKHRTADSREQSIESRLAVRRQWAEDTRQQITDRGQ